jgi:hypothetical protein
MLNMIKGGFIWNLWDVINWELFIHPLEKDKRSSIEVLSRRKVIKELLPCPITFYDYEDFYIFQYEQGRELTVWTIMSSNGSIEISCFFFCKII